ncbi:MAG: KEOPS complex kinase/ATPase Bud32 [Candidatus Thermoplasmatota archaeon]|nr:KEOPS complex kinase/ATPase Bud32 [Candidatus Thermoplasmatota archaeon]
MEQGVPWSEGPLIHEGAEGLVHFGYWFGKEAVKKVRRPRGYRDPSLDRALTKTRMLSEIRILRHLEHKDTHTPRILDADINSGTIIMTRIAGRPLFEHLRSSSTQFVGRSDVGYSEEVPVRTLLTMVGVQIRSLHMEGISHGDLTTHNIMWDSRQHLNLESGYVGIIDFGLGRLSSEIEALGQDLQVLNECLSASHPLHPYALDEILEGYASVVDDRAEPSANQVIERFNEIRGRVRYHG